MSKSLRGCIENAATKKKNENIVALYPEILVMSTESDPTGGEVAGKS